MATRYEYAKNKYRKINRFCQSLNIFPSIPPSTDRHQLQNEIISTRIFILLFTLSLTILILYTSLVTVTKTVTIDTPSLTQYSELYSKHSQTLVCPCTQISIKYDRVLSVNYTLHQVCASFLVTQDWSAYVRAYEGSYTYFDDFRSAGILLFQALNGFCNMVQQTILDNLIRFYSTEYVSGSVTSADLFQTQIKESTIKFREATVASFLSSLSIIRSTTHGNGLLSASLTDFFFRESLDNSRVRLVAQSYGACSCDTTNTCVQPLSVYNTSHRTILFTVPGFYMGCYAIEALLQSNLECFYDQTCIDTLKSFLRSSSSLTTEALDSSLPSEYQSNSTINDLLSQLMIEQWNLSVMYEGYYDKCQPAKCVYSYETRNDIIYIVTTVIGLIGGLITVLKLVIPRLVKFIRKQRGAQRVRNGKKIKKWNWMIVFCVFRRWMNDLYRQ